MSVLCIFLHCRVNSLGERGKNYCKLNVKQESVSKLQKATRVEAIIFLSKNIYKGNYMALK